MQNTIQKKVIGFKIVNISDFNLIIKIWFYYDNKNI